VIFEKAIPILRIFDEAKAREFYLDYLGFTVDFEHRFHDDAPLFMGVSHVLIDMRGVDELLDELRAKNYKHYNPGVQDQEWGRRDVAVIDPFKNMLIFSDVLNASNGNGE
jgi:uncharacterized glyoxalase superfamily protein PhnB